MTMDIVLHVLGWAAFLSVVAVGLLLDLVGLFGNWVILGAVGIAWAATGFTHFGPWAMAALAGLAVLGEVMELLAAGYGAAKFGGSRGSVVAALIGCIAGAMVGTPVLPLVGTVIGACLGAFAAAVAYEYLLAQKDVGDAVKTGTGAALGKVAGLFAKTAVGFVMLLIAAWTF